MAGRKRDENNMHKKFRVLLFLLILIHVGTAASLRAQESDTVAVVFTPAMSLRALAAQYLGNPDEWQMLLFYNDLQQLADLRPGMTLTIPTGSFARIMRDVTLAAETARRANMEGAGLLAKAKIDEANRLQVSALTLKNSGKLAAAESAAREAVQAAEQALIEAKAKKIQAVSAMLVQKAGTVQSRKPEQPIWAEAALKQALIEQERVRTLAVSLAGILFVDGSKISLSENSLAVIGAMQENLIRRSFQAEVTVLEGDVLAHLAALGGQKQFTINTPGVATAIRSKKFRTTRDAAQVTRIANYDGEIDVTANQGMVTIKKDEGTKIERGRKPSAPQKLLPPPVMLTPTVNQVLFSATVMLTWEAVAEARAYQLEISSARDFSTLLASLRVNAPQYTWQAPQKGVYYYRLYTVDKDNFAGPFAEPGAFYAEIDTTPPYLAVVAPGAGEVFLSADVTVQGTVEQGARLAINARPVVSAVDGSFKQTLHVQPGAQTITVTATDAAQNVTTIERQIVCNTAAQLLTLETPTQIVTNKPQVTFKGTRRPQTSVELDGTPLTLPEAFTHVLTLPEGAHVVTLKAIAPQGEVQTVPLHITVDLTPPEITLDDLPTATREPELRVTGALSEVATLTLADAVMPVATQRFEIPRVLQEGDNTFTLTATDSAGNTSTQTLRVALDTTPPEIMRAACALPETTGGEIIACEVSAADRGSGLAKTGHFSIAIGTAGQVVQGVLTFNRAKAVFEGSVFAPPEVSGAVAIKELRVQDRLGNETIF